MHSGVEGAKGALDRDAARFERLVIALCEVNRDAASHLASVFALLEQCSKSELTRSAELE